MRTSIIIGLCLTFTVLGGVAGANLQQIHDINRIEEAWDGITVVSDGTLVPNPSAYAYYPEDLAKAKSVRIINNRAAAITVAQRSTD